MDKRLEEVERIILQSFRPSNSPDDKDTVVQLGEIRNLPDAWILGMQLFSQSSEHVVRFFGLSLCRGCLENGDLSLEERIELRTFVWQSLSRYFKGNVALFTHELLNMTATLLVILIREDFPHQWENAFQDIIQLAVQCERLQMDFLVRFLQEFDQLIVLFDVNRSVDGNARCANIKDSLRDMDIPNTLCSQCFTYISSSSQSSSSICDRLLTCLGLLADWSDVNIFLQTDHINTIITALRDDVLCESACNCLIGIVKKKMNYLAKIQILAQFNIFSVLHSISPSSFSSACAISELVSEIGNAVYDYLDDDDTEFENDLNLKYLDLISKFWNLFDDPEAAFKLIDGMNRVLSSWKLSLSRNNHLIDLEGERIVSLIINKMRLPPSFEHDYEDDEDSMVLKTRESVGFLFVKCIRLRPDFILTVIQSYLSELPQPLSTCPFNDLECLLACLACFGDVIKSSSSPSDLSDVYVNIMMEFVNTDVAQHHHLSVIMAWLDLIDKQFKIFNRNIDPLTYVIDLCLSITSSSSSSSSILISRGCYLLNKLLSSSLDFIDEFENLNISRRKILEQIFEILNKLTEVEDLESIYESVGVIIGGNKSAQNFDEFFNLLSTCISSHVNFISDAINDSDEPGVVRHLSLLGKLCMGVSNSVQKRNSTSKGLKSRNYEVDGIFEYLIPIFNCCCVSLDVLYGNVTVRAKFMLVSHHFLKLNCSWISDKISDKSIKLLIEYCTIDDVQQVGHFLNQFMSASKQSSFMIIDSVFQIFLSKLLSVLNSDDENALGSYKWTFKSSKIDDNDDDQLEDGEVDEDQVEVANASLFKILRSILFNFISFVSQFIPAVLVSENNRHHIEEVLTLMIDGFIMFDDVALQKLVISGFSSLLKAWCLPNRELTYDAPSDDLMQLVVGQLLPVMMNQISSGNINARDGSSLLLLGDIGGLLYQVKCCQLNVMTQLEAVLVDLNWDRVAIDELMTILGNARDETHAKNNFRDFIRKLLS